MRIAFIFSPIGIRRPIDIDQIWSSERGLTGSEISFFMQAVELEKLGHEVCIFTNLTKPSNLNGIPCIPYERWETYYCKENWTAICAWNIANPLIHARPDNFRFLSQQCSGLSPSQKGWESYVDILAPLSHSHANQMKPYTKLPPDRWRILHNGVDLTRFKSGKKVPGRMIWASSPDRGLHHLLEMWPKIKKVVPHAHLHVFYDFHSIEHTANTYFRGANLFLVDDNFELGYRARYILEGLKRMQHLDIKVFKSASRNRIEEEMQQAEVLAYPLDPVYYTETFGVVVLEACASGVAPVLCASDCFPELWGSIAETVPAPYPDHKEEFFDKTIRMLTDGSYRNEVSSRCMKHAEKFQWSDLARGLESCLQSRGQTGLSRVNWNVT